MPNPFASARARAFQRQDGLCFYCSQPMWLGDSKAFAKYYQLSVRKARSFRCTAEHLEERQRGGRGGDNIAAACWLCNLCRHRGRPDRAPSPLSWRNRVQYLVQRGRWRVLKATPF